MRIKERRQREGKTFWVLLALADLIAGSVSAAFVLTDTMTETDALLWLAAQFSVRTIAAGMVVGLALYFYTLAEGAPVNVRSATTRALAGGVFGFLAGKTAAGFGLNENLQMAAAGVGGGKGPEYLDKAVNKYTGDRS